MQIFVNKQMNSKYLLIYIIVFFICELAWAGRAEKKIPFPVIVKGEHLQQLQGKNIEDIRVFAFHNGSPSVIPFQIDQKDANGNWVWDIVSNSDKHTMSNYDNEDPQGKRIFDDNDQLVFMAADIGEKEKTPSIKISSSYLMELEVFESESTMPSGWIYITYHSKSVPPLSNIRYMTYQPENNLVKSPIYSLRYSKHFIAAMDDMSIAGQSIINQTKLQGKVDIGFLLFNSSIEFNEKEIRGYSVGYINGPVRTIKRFITFINIAAGLKSQSLNVDHLFYPHHTEVPILITKGIMVKKMSIKIGAKYPNVSTDLAFSQSTKIFNDSKIKGQKNSLVKSEQPQFLALNSPDYSMLSMLKIPKELSSKLTSYAYIDNNSPINTKKKMSFEKNKQAGFYLATKDDFPSGQYQLNIVSIFSKKPHVYKRKNMIKNILNINDLIFARKVQKNLSIQP